MFIVAIAELGTSVEIEAAALAADHKTTVYEERLNLIAGLPAVILTTADLELARATLNRVRARGHGVIAMDAARVVSSSDMIDARRFRLEESGLAAGDPANSLLLWSDLGAIVRATHRRDIERITATQKKEFSLGRAVATGGLIISKKTSSSTSTTLSESEQVAYLFRRSGAAPWILREEGTQYGALGSEVAQSSMQNFAITLGKLRARAPDAAWDERLTSVKKVPERLALAVGRGSKSVIVSSESGIDLLAHLVATWLGGTRPKT